MSVAASALLYRVAAQFANPQIGRIGVAVSGGSDSTALLHLLAEAGLQLAAVTVDHNLRTEAASEARAVAAICDGIGVPHDILVWQHGEVTGNLMDQARRARYRLIGDWAQRRGIRHVVLGHTADDQAETLLMGLARAAGIDGLCGMRPVWQSHGISWSRPLLQQRRESLRDYLRERRIGWVDDPTNDNSDFTRIKARQAVQALAGLGVTVDRLATVAGNLSAVRAALDAQLMQIAAQIVQTAAGSLTMDRTALLAHPGEVQRRLLVAALRWVSNAEYAPRADAVARLIDKVRTGGDATLSGCSIRAGGPVLRIMREAKAVAQTVCATDQLWDGRWALLGPAQPGQVIRALGVEGLRHCKNWRDTGLSRDVLLASPAIWQGDALISAPIAGLAQGWSAHIDASFADFLLSH